MSVASTDPHSHPESHSNPQESYYINEVATDPEVPVVGILPHPLGVRPSGNALYATEDARYQAGLFGRIPDELMLTLLEWLDEDALMRLGSTCRALYGYSTYDGLWRDLWVARSSQMEMTWRGSWRASLLKLPTKKLAEVDCRNLFSDALHRPFLCSQIPLLSYVSNIPTSNQISRLEDLSPEEFAANWTNKPFILTKPVKQWPIFQNWSEVQMLEKFGQISFRAEAVDWPLRTYVEYM